MSVTSGAVAIIIVNWNGCRNTVNCIDSIRKSAYRNWHIFVVDNASTDNSVQVLGSLGPDVTLIESVMNAGWTGGNNIGIERALADGFDLLFILNNDTLLEEGAICKMVEYIDLDEGARAIVGPVHKNMAGTNYDFIGTKENDETGIPMVLEADTTSYDALAELYEVPYIMGAGILIRSEVFRKVGLFDSAYYLNYDEIDWSYRARAAGYSSYMVRDAVIRHIGSASIGGATSPLSIYFQTRNCLLFAERHIDFRRRLRVWRGKYREARGMSGGGSPARWISAFVKSSDPKVMAFRFAVRDYLLRRFGDCPARIRQLR